MSRKDMLPPEKESTTKPRWKPTTEQREQVKSLAGRGVPQRMIAAIIGTDHEAMLRECRAEYDEGRAIAVANVTGVLYKRALSEDQHSFRDRQFYLVNVGGFSSGRQQIEASSSLEDLVGASMKKGDDAAG